MNEIEVTCIQCAETYIVKEYKLQYEKQKNKEKALCPNCHTEIFSGQTNGWYYVKDNKKPNQEPMCKYPMP